MSKFFHKLFFNLKSYLPLLGVIFIALIIALQNIKLGTFYSGWDNIHAEFDLTRYARQVFFGAWLEHQSLGAPAAQGHLAEIPRLPILFLLKTLLPDNLVRYVFIFTMYLIGGIGTYFYLLNYWLKHKSATIKKWLAGLGAVFYLLHILTLQQFYISFEMFTVQFAYLPFLLITIHLLAKKINLRHFLIFAGVQLLIAPSGHTPTVFYLGTMLTMVYGFFLKFHPHKLLNALKFTFLIGLFSFLLNAYWIAPNLYYSFHNADYVQQSRDNQLFGPESVWSVREAGTFSQFLTSTHYLFNWKDYSFANHQFDYIFNEWQDHLSQPLVTTILTTIGAITFLGLFATLFNRKIGQSRFGIIFFYLFCLIFIWIDLFPTSRLFDQLYQSGSFLEAFRNPFTKLSILYSFVSVILFTQALSSLTQFLKKPLLTSALIILVSSGLIYQTWPSFQGHFISEKLRVKFPQEYQQLFSYLKTQDPHLRILQLPQLSHAGWVYHDWSFIEPGNGYQGMGFVPFGVKQPVINRDTDRWVETSDFFYHELKYALDSQNPSLLSDIFQKYQVDLVIIDETKIDPALNHDYQLDHQLITEAGLTKVWQDNFLSVYQHHLLAAEQQILSPPQITLVDANTNRVRLDYIYQNEGDYILTQPKSADLLYPFSDLSAKEVEGVSFNDRGVEIIRNIPADAYQLTLPGFNEKIYLAPAAITWTGQAIEIVFPNQQLQLDQQLIQLPKLADFTIQLTELESELALFFNNFGVVLRQGETVYPVIPLAVGDSIDITYTNDINQLSQFSSSSPILEQIVVTPISSVDFSWDELIKEQRFQLESTSQIKLVSTFPVFTVNLLQTESVNCSSPIKGEILTVPVGGKARYQASQHGINCNGYNFEYVSPATSYILNIAGKTIQGRGLKFFLNYSDGTIRFEDYLMQDENYDKYLTLHQVSPDPNSRFSLNWETRSFGRNSINQLNYIQLSPFPLTTMSQLRLEKNNTVNKISNNVQIDSQQRYLDFIYLVDYSCGQEKCYLVLDQSYDDLWLGLNTKKWQILPHSRLNNWANAWETSGEGKLVIFYLPELISLFSLGGLGIGLIVLVKKSLAD